jgi:hypothetical protein
MEEKLQVNKVHSHMFVVRKLKPELFEAVQGIAKYIRQSVPLRFTVSKVVNVSVSPSKRDSKPNVQFG